jgi:ABC-type lipoprotein export system ATPase subunit
MISMKDVTKKYSLEKGNDVVAVKGATLEIAKGEFVVITGRSGSGKTTLLNLAGGLTRPTSGEIRIDGRDIWQMADRQQSLLRNHKIGFVFQFPSLVPSLTALENVMLPRLFGDHPENGCRDRGIDLLGSVGLASKLNAYPRQLSAGQQQRVVIARALINQTQILLADEPTSDLDEQTENEIMALFQKLHEQTGITIILVTHTSQLVSYGTRWLEMAGGAVVRGSNQAPSSNC